MLKDKDMITGTLRQVQTITGVLFDDKEITSPEVASVKNTYFVPYHSHKHSELTGLLNDDHPQYLTDQRGIDLFNTLVKTIEKLNVGSAGDGVSIVSSTDGDSVTLRGILAGAGIVVEVNGDDIVISVGDIDGGTY